MDNLGQIGCIVLLGAAMAPAALAHGDSAARSNLFQPLGYDPSWSYWPPSYDSHPAGWYYGSVFAAQATLQAFQVGPSIGLGGSPPCPVLVGVPAVDDAICGLVVRLDASQYVAPPTPDALCDLEVGGDGTSPQSQDETIVDGSPSGVGQAPDGRFNDGGIGGVCHTHSGYYGYAPYNTRGCPAGVAYAGDADLGGNVWITATCDMRSPTSADPLLTKVLSDALCTAHDVVTSAAFSSLPCDERFAECLTGLTPDPVACPGAPGASCIPDGIADYTNSGHGGPGVPYPGISADCLSVAGDSSQATFVWDSVQATVTPSGDVTLDQLDRPCYGWIS